MNSSQRLTYLNLDLPTKMVCLMCIVVSLCVLTGWTLDITVMKSLHPSFVAMNPLTAMCFMLASLSLFFIKRNKLSNVFAGLVLAISSIKLLSFIGVNLGIDQIMFTSSLSGNTMAPNTALCFFFIGLALISCSFPVPGKKVSLPDWLSLVPLVISLFSILGYIYGVSALYGFGNYIPMALNTAILFFCLSSGIIVSLPKDGFLAILTRVDAGGDLLRRLLPSIIFIPPLLSWLRITGESMGLYQGGFGVSLLAISAIAVLAILTFICAVRLSKSDQILLGTNMGLEIKINDRLSELKETEKQIQHLQKMDAIGRLAGGVAHDFNNILGAIQMYCEILQDESHNPEQVKNCSNEVRKASERGAALTEQLLLFSRQRVYQFKAINLNDLINGHVKMLHRLIREDIQIVTKLGNDLPHIEVDPGQIEQVIMNLVINARDAMPGGGRISIETRYQFMNEDFTSTHLTVNAGPCVLLTITDTGEGMSEEIQSQIFDPFFTTKEMGKGTGLGLSTVYGIIKSSKATIWVYSEIGKGSVFKIYFPASSQVHTELAKQVKTVNLKGHETILLVEDEIGLRNLFELSLIKHGYNVIVAQNGDDALSIIKSDTRTIDLLLTDVIMPGLGGMELVNKALELSPELKVLYMSGYTNESIELPEELKGKMGFIQKPFNSQTLTTKIREFF